MNVICYGLVASLLYSDGPHAGALTAVGALIRRHEELGYDREPVRRQQERFRREAHPHAHVLRLDFRAFHRAFHLRLKRDTSGFAENFQIHLNGSRGTDLSHIYSGEVEDEDGSSCHGSIIEGQFEGVIRTENGTFHVEPLRRYSAAPSAYHSVIYREDDIDLSPLQRSRDGFCGAEQLRRLTQNLRQSGDAQGETLLRSRRTVDHSKTSCHLHLHADHLYFKRFGSVQAVVAQIASYMNAVNDIYNKADFDGIRLINFKVKSLSVITEEDASSPLSQRFIGPERLLSLFSEMTWGEYCLSYLLTDRDYSGVLGLAWEGRSGNVGGICSQATKMQDGGMATLNTGLITLQNYGRYLSPWHVQLTLAHELGHSLGAPHDVGTNCGSLGSTDGKGRFLMFPHATDGLQENNDKFSPCSIKHISSLLRVKKDDCFVESDQPICGNLIVEEGEQCDVGHNETDPCCYSAKERKALRCHLKPGIICSPSQGLCCSSLCTFTPYGVTCEEASECRLQTRCSGAAAACPAATGRLDMTPCGLGTRVCQQGECSQSLCTKHGMEQCDCPADSMSERCYMCCQQPGSPRTCASTTSSVLQKFFQGRRLPLVPGAACSDKKGFCDKFHVCRLLDADGPLARLKNSFLHLNEFDDISDWMKGHWWAILLAILTLSTVTAGTAFFFGRET
ncbi:disintegrin and metalloproteinase domain-containing protein 10 isoform X1 [Brienomyrus brachyistius]|uniref:disintegrin and metalloproteinase domain-containing protein 10 isoform X1 n=1 Tax=Brienomyrus brachyistius TaxID=42636 RepID=UPI0020B45534|nr:disintegrin and metalloproteinase domain-containing protein 10 isoform X1 [Brienomyrus brachyistius]